ARKDHISIGDVVAAGVANVKLHRNGAACLRENAGAVSINWLLDDAAASAVTEADRKLPIYITNVVVTKSRAYRCARRHRRRSDLRQSGRRITRGSKGDVGYRVAVDEATYVQIN